MFNESKISEVVVVRGGTVDGASKLRPIGHIWTRSSQPWVRIPEGALSYPGQPPDMLELVRAWRARPSDPWEADPNLGSADDAEGPAKRDRS